GMKLLADLVPPSVNTAVPVQDGLRPEPTALRSLPPSPRFYPPPLTRLRLVARGVGPRQTAERLTPPLVPVVLASYAAPAPGGSGGSFSSRACLFAPSARRAAWQAVEARRDGLSRPIAPAVTRRGAVDAVGLSGGLRGA